MAQLQREKLGSWDELLGEVESRDDVLMSETPVVVLSADEPVTAVFEQRYECDEGPFIAYERVVTLQPDSIPGQYRLSEQINYRTKIPYWAVLFAPVVKRALRSRFSPTERPWWLPPDRLSSHHVLVICALAAFNVLAGILYGLLTQIMTYIAADLGSGLRSEQTDLLAVVRLGIVITMIAMVVADRVGRRRVALWCFATSGVLSLACAFAPNLTTVGALQFFARNLALAGLLCVDTVAIEELPRGTRALATGLGTLAYGLGAGIVVVTIPIADSSPSGWRFAVAGVAATTLLIFHARKYLPESARFLRERQLLNRVVGTHDQAGAVGHAAGNAVRGRVDVTSSDSGAGKVQPSRLILVCTVFLLFNIFLAPATQMQNDYLRTEHLMSGVMISVFVVLTSTPGGLGVLAGGRLADVRGRRAAIIPGLIATGVFGSLFFMAAGSPMWFFSLAASVVGGLATPALGVITSELFPTLKRTTIRGVVTGAGVVGSVIGLLVAGWLIDDHGYPTAFMFLGVAPVVAGLLAWRLPPTHNRELEELNP